MRMLFKDDLGCVRERVLSDSALRSIENSLKFELEVSRPVGNWHSSISGPAGLWFGVRAFMDEVQTPVGAKACLAVTLTSEIGYPAETVEAIEALGASVCRLVAAAVPHHIATPAMVEHLVSQWDTTGVMERIAA